MSRKSGIDFADIAANLYAIIITGVIIWAIGATIASVFKSDTDQQSSTLPSSSTTTASDDQNQSRTPTTTNVDTSDQEANGHCDDVTSYDYNWDNDVKCTRPDGSVFYTDYAGGRAYDPNF